MSDEVKYRLLAYSSKYNDEYRVDICENGYTGSILYRNIGAGKLRIEKKEGIIQQKSLYISIQSDSNFEYLGFFQYDNRKHPVKLYKNDTLIWSGYIIAESYQEPYINPPYDVEIVATDGLGFLDNYTFSSTEAYLSRLQAIKTCIDNLGLSLEYEIAIDLFEENMDTSLAMLDQTYFQGHIFNDQKCSDVIEALLPFGTTLTQKNNRWLIRRPYEDAEKTHLIYTSEGVYSTTVTGESVLQMGAVSEAGIWPHVSPLLQMEHAWSKVTLKSDYGKQLSFFKNYDFSLGDLTYWTNEIGSNVIVRADNSGKKHLLIPGYVDYGTLASIYQRIGVQQSTLEEGYFLFSLKVGLFAQTSKTVKFRVTLYRPIFYPLHKVYLSVTEGWTQDATIIEQELNPSGPNFEMTEIKIYANDIPFSGTLMVELFQLEAETGGNPRTVKSMSVFFTDIQAITSETLQQPDTEEIEISIRENAVSDGGTIELKPIDLPQIANSKLIFNNGNYYESGGAYILTKLWKNNSGDLISFTDILKNQIINYYSQPRQIISGCTWRGEGLHLESISQHILNSQRKFIADRGTWNILDDDFDIIWIEKPGSAASGAEWILEDALWGDHGEIWVDEETWEDTDV